MMRKLIILLLVLFSLESIGQNYREYLEKYWYYRHQLKDKFMYYNGDANVQGAHHLAENKYDENTFIRWSDGVWWLGHYIGVLALEYKLLKETGQDYTETLEEINLAFDTFERLDYNAEPCFNNIWGNPGSQSKNGFFLRDDLNESCSPNFNNYDIYADYYHCQDGTESNVNSQDQCIMMFLGLNLVKKLVSDPGIQSRSEEIAGLVIKRMRWFNILVMEWVWEIRNPVTLGVPAGGHVFELYSFCWALAQAAYEVTGEIEHKGYSLYNKPQFDIAQELTWDILQGGNPIEKFTGYFTCVLSAIVNDGIDRHPSSDGKAYDWLYEIYNKTKAYEGMPVDVGLFPHLPAITEVLHGYDGDNQIPASLFESKFLDNAPLCGSYNYGEGDNSSPPWHTMSLFSPWHGTHSGDYYHGEYNMLDYAMLYNLYFYIYLMDDILKPYVVSEGICPELIDLPDPHNDFWVYTVDDPKMVKAAIQIKAYENINDNGGVVYQAGEEIKFMPGFYANSGSYVLASIDPTLINKPYYIKTNNDLCNGGTFEPITVSYNPAVFPTVSNQPQFPDSIWQVQNWGLMDSLFGGGSKNSELNIEIQNEIAHGPIAFPNPTNGQFHVNLPDSDPLWLVQIVDFTGQLIHSYEACESKIFSFDLTGYKPGMYFVHLRSKNTDHWLKVVKN